MKDEVKEILDKLKDENNYQVDCNDGSAFKELFANEIKLLLDYMINLQTIEQQYSALLSENAELENKITNLQEEIERLNNIINELEKYLRKVRQITFDKYNSNEWNNCLSFNDDIKPILDKLKELKEGDNND